MTLRSIKKQQKSKVSQSGNRRCRSACISGSDLCELYNKSNHTDMQNPCGITDIGNESTCHTELESFNDRDKIYVYCISCCNEIK